MRYPRYDTPVEALREVVRRVERLQAIYRSKAEDPDLSDPEGHWMWWERMRGLAPLLSILSEMIEAQGEA